MSTIEQKEYDKALRIVNAYPEALKVIKQFESEKKFKFENTHIDLRGELSVRACNVIKQYCSVYFPNSNPTNKWSDRKTTVGIDEWNFPIELLTYIDMKKIKSIKNCGQATYNSILVLVEKYTK